MRESKVRQPVLSRRVKRLVHRFESEDMGDAWERMPRRPLRVRIKRRTHMVAVDGNLMGKVVSLARERRTSCEALIGAWLQEQVRKATG